jgi:hypothetical protein
MPKEITYYVFLGEKRDQSEIYANSNLRNLTHITQKAEQGGNRLVSTPDSERTARFYDPKLRIDVGI